LGKDASRRVPTSDGDTKVFCGGRSHPPMVLFQGLGACFLIHGEWLISTVTTLVHHRCGWRHGSEFFRAMAIPRTDTTTNKKWRIGPYKCWNLFWMAIITKSAARHHIGISLGSHIAACVALSKIQIESRRQACSDGPCRCRCTIECFVGG
jgi:hypothetical protein